ncbi:rhodanese-like domain-containing protein [Rubrivirga sp. S365]|uniref:Rhodanese-like domain-containing protein n=1 Tax=Rubrivirga litoralis TaxID=3075598 RepID=A0ABU3BTI1_9BACT|nr:MULTISPECIES: rhodanese-like domain-containing protein [unclassified Rubrivirga]MDT0632597.1 rhodanese-like domain-containing protein [Rubrivirga sp. F394]MDT7856713.1 rhodanese-like domain-containing protein [Rubrivirga sp. S365]
MLLRQIHDPSLAQYAYLVGCQKTGEALVVDPERDVDRVLALAAEEGLTITHVAETHIHADFLSGARDLAERTGARLYLSAEGESAGWGSDWAEGRDDVTFLRDGDTFAVGNVEVRAVYSPGHTPEHLAYLVTDHGGGADAPMGLLSGDFVFVGDLGRPDLLEQAAGQAGAQEPAARQLYASVQRFLDLDDFVQVWPAHGAGSACGKALGAVPQSTVGYERRFNGAIDAARRGEPAFVEAILDGQPEPPLYFARMKAQNRDGVPPLAALPTPRALAPDELAAPPAGAVVVDTRPDRSAFMAAHLPGALYAPLGSTFSTVVGSYVTDPETPLVLVVPEGGVGEAVRALVRIGLDRVVAYATYETLAAYAHGGGDTAAIPEVDFEAVAGRAGGAAVLDVRRQAEVDAGHVPGAAHIAHTRLADRLDEVPDGSPLYVHCQSGARAAVAGAFLASRGYDVAYVNDGFAHYREVGPVETGEPAGV